MSKYRKTSSEPLKQLRRTPVKIHWSSSLSVISQFILSETRWALVTVDFLMFLTIASSNKTRKDGSGLLSMILLVANAVGPGLKIIMFCCCKRPHCSSEIVRACQAVSSYPVKTCFTCA